MENAIKKDKRTENLTQEEIDQLKELSKSYESFSEFSIKVRVERTALINTLSRGSAAPATVRKIRKFLSLQPQAA